MGCFFQQSARTPQAQTRSMATLAQKAEALGFDSIWVPDHVVFPKTINSTYPYNDSGRIGTAPI